MTQYVETFHWRNGVYVDADVLAIPELTPRWNYNVRTPLVMDARASTDNFDVWGLTIEDPIHEGVDVRFAYFQTAGKLGGFSITRCPSFADGSILVKCSAQRKPLAQAFSTALMLRSSGTTSTPTQNCYVAGVMGNSGSTAHRIKIYKVVSGTWTSLGESGDITGITPFDNPIHPTWPEIVCYFEFQAVGTALKARIWSVDAVRPETWNLEITDGSITAAGWAVAGSGNPSSPTMRDTALAFISVSSSGGTLPYIPKDRDERRRFLEGGEVGVVLFKAGVLGTTDGGTTGLAGQVLISNVGDVTEPGDFPASTAYPSRITSIGEMSQTLNGETFTGRSTQGFGDISVHNENGVLDHWLRWNWAGRPFSLFFGSRLWHHCDFILGARGTIDRVEKRSASELVFKLRDGSNLLNRKIDRAVLGGSTINAAKPEPILYGYGYNITPVLINDTTHQYRYNSLGSHANVTAARENGASIIGSVTNGTDNEFTLSAAPAGDVTIDVVGGAGVSIYGVSALRGVNYPISNALTTVNVNYTLNAAFKFFAYLCSRLALDQIYVNPELNLSNDSGVYISAEEDPAVAEVLDQIVASSHGAWYWNNWGELMARYLDLASAYGDALVPAGFVVNLQEGHLIGRSLKPVKLIPPAVPRKFYYKKNWTKQTNMAGSVAENDRAYYASEGILVEADPGTSGLDQPSSHLAVRELGDKTTLVVTVPSAVSGDAFIRENTNNSKTVGVFEFQTRAFFQELEVMRTVDLVHSRYGFNAGQRGVVVGLRRNFKNRISTVQWATQLSGDWPAVTAAYPFVGSGEFL